MPSLNFLMFQQELNSYFNTLGAKITKTSRTLPYTSSNQARDELDSFFDHKLASKPKHYISAKKALKELDYIFPTKKGTVGKVHSLPKAAKEAHSQVLAFSHSEAKDDLDSYFDNLDTDTHSHAWSDMDSTSQKYIENKRKAIHNSHGSSTEASSSSKSCIASISIRIHEIFAQVDKNGNAVEVKKVWTAVHSI